LYYDKLTSNWQTELEKKIGLNIRVEVIYDPNGKNILLSGKHDLISITPITNIRDIDLEYGIKTPAIDVTMTFNDPDRYFDTRNENSPFHNAIAKLYEDTASGSSLINIEKENHNFAVWRKIIY